MVQTVEIKVIFENDRVRVLHVRIPPGGKTEMHSHPAYLTYALTPAKVRARSSDGTVREVERKEGEVFFSEEVTHIVENIGSEVMLSLDFELK